MVAILSQRKPDALAEYLWFLIGHGQILWVEEVAVSRLGEREASDPEEYLKLLVAALAWRSYLPEELPRQTTSVLMNLETQPSVSEGAREVLRLHEGTDFDPASYGWWAEQGLPNRHSSHAESPRQAFRHLIRSLGEAQEKRGASTRRGNISAWLSC